MTIVATEDTRNLEWRKSNVGATLLQKMGWKEGQGIGKRSTSGTSALRALRRQDGLGLGAKIDSQGGGDSERSDHFSSVLQKLQSQHSTSFETDSSEKKKKKRKETQALILAQNRVNAGHSRKLRESKFGARSAEDMAAIFGNREFQAVLLKSSTEETSTKEEENDSDSKKEKSREKRKRSDKKKKKSKKRKTDSNAE